MATFVAPTHPHFGSSTACGSCAGRSADGAPFTDDDAARHGRRLAGVQAALALTDHHAAESGRGALIAERSDVQVGRAGPRLLRRWREASQVGNRVSCRRWACAAVGASFVEVFVAGSGTVLVHDRELLDVIGWVSSLAPDTFISTVPLLRRTFGGFEPAERRQLGMLLADLAPASGSGPGRRGTTTAAVALRDRPPDAGVSRDGSSGQGQRRRAVVPLANGAGRD